MSKIIAEARPGMPHVCPSRRDSKWDATEPLYKAESILVYMSNQYSTMPYL